MSFILDLGTGWKWVISVKPGQIIFKIKPPVTITYQAMRDPAVRRIKYCGIFAKK
jgi:hypothetical protein